MREQLIDNDLEDLFAKHLLDIGSCILQLCGYRILVDLADRNIIEQYTWHTYRIDERVIFQTRVLRDSKLIKVNLPRVLLNPPDDQYAVRRQGANQWDYRKQALQVCTSAEKAAQLGKRKIQTTSRFKGVSRCKRSGLWVASIRPNGQSLNLGLFGSEIEAARAYNQSALKHFGEHAFQNDLPDTDDFDLKKRSV